MPLLRGPLRPPLRLPRGCASPPRSSCAELPEGAVAATDNQTAGRGRRGRQWVIEPPAPASCSRCRCGRRRPPERLAPFSLVLAEAVCEALDERALVRWPNDVLVDGRKLAGVLPELRGGQLIAGIGINADAHGRAAAAPTPACRRRRCAAPRRAGRPRRRAGRRAARDRAALRPASSGDGFTGLERNELAGRRVRLAGGAGGHRRRRRRRRAGWWSTASPTPRPRSSGSRSARDDRRRQLDRHRVRGAVPGAHLHRPAAGVPLPERRPARRDGQRAALAGDQRAACPA